MRYITASVAMVKETHGEIPIKTIQYYIVPHNLTMAHILGRVNFKDRTNVLTYK